MTITSGAGLSATSSTGAGGAVSVVAGAGPVAGAGGAASLLAGASTSGTGGAVAVTAGASTGGVAGAVAVTAGASSSANHAGGAVAVTGGAGGAGGALTLGSGAGGAATCTGTATGLAGTCSLKNDHTTSAACTAGGGTWTVGAYVPTCDLDGTTDPGPACPAGCTHNPGGNGVLTIKAGATTALTVSPTGAVTMSGGFTMADDLTFTKAAAAITHTGATSFTIS